jgi:hypothetical protein
MIDHHQDIWLRETYVLLSMAGDRSSSKKSCFVSDGSALEKASSNVSKAIINHPYFDGLYYP